MNCLSVFDHFVGLSLEGLTKQKSVLQQKAIFFKNRLNNIKLLNLVA